MAASTVIKNFTDGQLTIKDGTGTPITLVVPYEQGNFSLTGLNRKLRNVVAYESRGSRLSVRHTTRNYPAFSFSAFMAQFNAGAAAATVLDALLKGTGTTFAAAVSTLGAAADVYTVDLAFSVEGTDFGDSADPTFTLEDCHCSIDWAEGDPNAFTITGTVYGAITGDITLAEA